MLRIAGPGFSGVAATAKNGCHCWLAQHCPSIHTSSPSAPTNWSIITGVRAYDRLLRSPDRRIQQDPDATARLWSYLEGLTCPTLVVRGAESDIIAKETAGAMHERIPNGRLATVPNAGHLVMGDNPAGFEQAVTGFLSSFA